MNKKWISLFEVLIFYGLVHVVLWGSVFFRPPILVIAIILISICVGSNLYHKDSIERIGLARKNFKPALKLTAIWVLPFIIPALLICIGKAPRPGWDFWFAILGYPVWGFAQQYALLGFVANRLEDAFPGRFGLIALTNGILFGSVHLPNPLLTPLCFAAGFLFTFLFFKKRHLIPLALAHALFGVVISWATSQNPALMSVGPAYLKRIGQLVLN